MKYVCLLLGLAIMWLALEGCQQPLRSQQFTPPRTTVIKDAEGRTVSTATTWGNITVYRNADGELTGSSKITADGTTTYYDPNGKVTGTATTEGNVTTIRNAAGEVTGTRTQEGNATVIRDAKGRLLGKTEPRQ